MPVMGLLTFIIIRAFDQPIDWSNSLPPAMIVPIGLLIWLLGALPEEYGWRGYALPRLQRTFNPLIAGIILGVIWGLWHLPLHFIETTTQFAIPVWEYLAQTIVLSIIYTWLFKGTVSVFVAILFHTFGNLTGAIFPYWTSSVGRWISFILLIITAVIIVVVKGTHFHKNKVTQLEL
jgi:membrane protease YdiL (CAAX protease family)